MGKSSAGDIQLKSNNDTMWLGHKTKCRTIFSKQMKLLMITHKKKSKNPRHTVHNIHIFIFTLFTPLMPLIISVIAIWKSVTWPTARFFYLRNGIIVICILMNILQCVYIILCSLYPPLHPIQYYFPGTNLIIFFCILFTERLCCNQ